MEYRLNFITTTAVQWRRQRIQRFALGTYIILILATGFIFYKLYESFDYMSTVLSDKVFAIEQQISDIEPQILLLKNRISQRNKLHNRIEYFTQAEQRPALWYLRLKDIASSLPDEMELSEIHFASTNQPDKKVKNSFGLSGKLIINDSDSDIFMVDQFRSNLSESPSINVFYKDVKISNNNIFKEGENLKLTYSMEIE